ncbi:Protein of unknown function [Lactobacillus gigeriorum DSM 23908 = CRBIP 24.85]|uniref:Uncharacterized protein n=1 Tax=Lactobacillus gigeriorum DSM 23908 = CRBIP 24.85 TaxID=1423751 RepID=I7LF73_9LACO|nr:Protein of unknown function [Lactobacillus gigeriorum DSM 23908 = CRBIP 24.85]
MAEKDRIEKVFFQHPDVLPMSSMVTFLEEERRSIPAN